MHVTLIDPTTDLARFFKVGFSWTLFLFTPFFGAPLFVRGLVIHGLAVAAVCVLSLFLQDSAGLILIGFFFLAAMLFYGIKGNELTIDHLLTKGWQFADSAGPTVPVQMRPVGAATANSVRSAVSESDAEAIDQSADDSEKTCPLCAETVKAAALICKHCGASFVAQPPHPAPLNYHSQNYGVAKGVAIAVLAVVALMVASLVAYTVMGNPTDTTLFVDREELAATADQDQSPALAVTATQLLRAYEANEQAAQLKYEGHVLEISGAISSIELDGEDLPMVSLKAGDWFGEVTLHFSEEYASDTASLRRGEQFTARCTNIVEFLGLPQLYGCMPIQSVNAAEAQGARAADFTASTFPEQQEETPEPDYSMEYDEVDEPIVERSYEEPTVAPNVYRAPVRTANSPAPEQWSDDEYAAAREAIKNR